MNKFVGIGRLTKDPDIRYTQDGMTIARYTLAIDRKTKDKATDFITCVAFGKNGEFAEKYLKKGTKIAVVGRVQTGNYKNKDGQTVYTTDIVVEEHEFVESKKQEAEAPPQTYNEGFMAIPEGAEDAGLPFN